MNEAIHVTPEGTATDCDCHEYRVLIEDEAGGRWEPLIRASTRSAAREAARAAALDRGHPWPAVLGIREVGA